MDWENLDFDLCNVDFADPNLIQELNLESYPDLSKIDNNQEKYNTIKDFFTEAVNNLQHLNTERDTVFFRLQTCEMNSQIYRDLKIDFIKALYRSAIVDHQREQAHEYLKFNKPN
ncbi:hypothetical protein QKC54_gp0931 [Megavirus baoshan]|uniref:Uncharacterized protein n=1 Tax=Megavirus baoshan TaxID=2496520 RepID=A0A3Q8U899_9VIRU|nr:hypothetical protein QKC54_gp0931 [Megavirus baoshan]AZL89606.1 hypothetical protein Mb0141 [Megavirus baoshan]